MSEILVIGTAERDTIFHTESRRLRQRLGGVGAIVAEELARLGYHVTMLAPLGDDDSGRFAKEALWTLGIDGVYPKVGRSAEYMVCTINGEVKEPTIANFPSWDFEDLASEESLEKLIMGSDLVVMDTSLSPNALMRIAKMATPDFGVVVSDTSSAMFPLVVQTIPSTFISMNDLEVSMLGNMSDTRPKDFDSEHFMITLGPSGWTVRSKGKWLSAAGPEVPAEADFNGAGDSAAAGLIHSIMSGNDQEKSINSAIRGRLERNAG